MSQIDDFLDGKAAPSAAPKVSAIDAFLGEDKPKQNKGLASDVLTAVKQGALQLPGVATGILDIAPGALGIDRPASKAADFLGSMTGFQPGKWAKEANAEYSPETQQAKSAVDQAWDDPNKGAADVAAAYLQNPRTIGLAAAQSVPSMLAGGLVGRGIGMAAGIKSAAARAAIGEGAVMAGSTMDQIDASVDPQKAAAASLVVGAGGAAIGAGGAKIASRFGNVDIDSAIAGGVTAPTGKTMSLAKRVPAGILQEGLLEEAPQSALETGAQNWAEGKPLTEGMARNVTEGALAGGLMGGGAAALTRQQQAQGLPDPNTAVEPPAQAPAPQPPAPALGYNPQAGTHTVFPDGTVVLNSETPAGEQAVFDKRFAPQPVTPSEAMGIDPNAGAISRVAAEAVDGPASIEMAVRQAERDMAALAAEDNPEAGADARPTFNDPLEAQVAGYVAEMGTASPQMVAAKFGVTIPRATELLALTDPTVDDLFPPPQGAANVSNADAAGALAAGTGGPVGADTTGSGPDAGLLGLDGGRAGAGTAGAPAPSVQESDAAPVPGQQLDPALTAEQPKPKSLKEAIARKKAERANVQDQPQAAAPEPAPAPAPAVQAPQAVGSDGAAQPGAAPAGSAGVEADGVAVKKQEFKVEGSDPHTVSYAQRPDGRLLRTINYPDGQSSTDTLVTDKKGDETWVSDDRYAKGEFYPKQLSPADAEQAIREDMAGKPAAPAPAPAAAPAAAQGGKPVKAIVLDAPVEQALQAVKDSPSAQTQPTKVVPQPTTEPTNGTQTSEAIPQEAGREEAALLSDSVSTEPNLEAAKALLARQKAATGNAVAEGKVRKELRDLAAKTPETDAKTVLALDTAATRLGMGEGKLKGLEFMPAASSRLKRDLSGPAPAAAPAVAAPAPAPAAAPASAEPILAKREDGTLKNKNEYTEDEWKTYTKSVIDVKLGDPVAPAVAAPAPSQQAQAPAAAPATETGGITKAIENAKRLLRETRNKMETEPAQTAARRAELKAREDSLEREIRRLRQQAVADEPVAAPAPAPTEAPTPNADGSTIVGRRKDGVMIRKDKNGVRFYTDGGVRVSETVELRPTRQGMQMAVGELKPDFMTAEEAEAAKVEKAPKPVTVTPAGAGATAIVIDPGATRAQADPDAAAKAKAQADLDAALGDLGDIFGKNTRASITPEQEQKLLPVLTRVMDAAFRLGYYKFKDAARFVIDTIRSKMGNDVADQITLDHLQGAYIGMAGKYQDQGASTKKEVVAVESLADLNTAAKPSLYTAEGRAAIAQMVADHLIGDGKFASINDARKFITEKTGEGIPPGTKQAKMADETVELGVVMAARDIVQAARKQGRSDEIIFDRLVNLYNAQPNLAVRDSTSIRNQAYSTPVPMAFVASRLAGIKPGMKVGELTAGNGALMIEVDPKDAVVNELNPDRMEALRSQGFTPTSEDATTLKVPAKSLDAINMNPPFGALDGKRWDIGGLETGEIDHAIVMKSLEALKDDGSAVFIIGGVNARETEARRQAYRGKAKREFFATLYGAYNVVDHFTLDGGMYSRQGAGFPVDVLVIRGRGKSKRMLPAATPPKFIENYDQLKEKLNADYGGVEPAGSGAGVRGNSNSGGVIPDAGGVSVTPVGAPGLPVQGGGQVRPEGSNGASDGGRADLGAVGPRGNEPRPANPANGAGAANPQAQAGAVNAEGGSDNQNQRQGSGTGPEGGQSAGVGSDAAGKRATDRQGVNEAAEAGKLQVKYESFSQNKSVNTLVATNHLTAIENAFQNLRARVGDVDAFVRKELDYDPEQFKKAFSAEQVEALALAIDNIRQGKGFIIGDQTGIGKGRVVAAMIRYAKLNGKTPVFVTQMPDLYGDMMRDLNDIGMSNVRPLMTNNNASVPLDGEALAWFGEVQAIKSKVDELTDEVNNILREDHADKLKALEPKDVDKELRNLAKTSTNPEVISLRQEIAELNESKPAKRGKFLDTPNIEAHEKMLADMVDAGNIGDYDVIFTTYTQMDPLDSGRPKKDKNTGQKTPKAPPKFGYRDTFLTNFINNNAMLILDESHNAGAKGDGKFPSRGDIVRKFIANSGSVFYSSATFAKNPEVMDAYSKTDLGKAFGNSEDLTETVSNVPIQQVTSTMLVEAGQYLRRERSFDGIEYDSGTVEVDQQAAEDVSTAMRLIVAFDKAKKGAIKDIQNDLDQEGAAISALDGGASTASVDSVNFTSVMHNVINTFLLALKSDAAADAAVQAIRNGEKPVLTVANTMEMFINEYAKEAGLTIGDKLDATFADVLKRYLEKTRYAMIRRPGGSDEKVYLTDEQLGADGLEAYNLALEFIEDMELNIPLSPIDHIKAKIEEAGFSIGEITGRQTVVVGGVLRQRNKAEMNTAGKKNTIAKFNNGQLDALIINRSGSTGLSMHASETFADQRRRVMVIAQAELDINNHMQMLGRVNRTGQVTANGKSPSANAQFGLPRYVQLSANVPIEMRPAAVLANKMANLNANTTAGRKSAVEAKNVPDFMNKYGDRVAAELVGTNPELNERLGYPLKPNEDGDIVTDGAMAKVTGRIGLLPLKQQSELYEALAADYQDLIAQLEALGQNELEAKTYPLDAKTLEKRQVMKADAGPQSPFTQAVFAETVSMRKLGRPYPKAKVQEMVAASLGGKTATEVYRETLNAVQAQIDQEVRDLQVQRAAADIKTAPGIDKQIASLNAAKVRFREMLPGIGMPYVLKTENGNIYGVVTAIEKKGKAKSAGSLSAWKIKFAVVDGARSMTIPMTQLANASDKASANAIEIAPAPEITIPNADRTGFDTVPVMEAFDRGQTDARETRIMITGNILRGYGALRGRLMNYTDDQGNIRQGILMPADKDMDDIAGRFTPSLKMAQEMIDFLNKGGVLIDKDSVGATLKITMGGSRIRLETSKTGLGKKLVKDAQGVYFASSGSKMVANLYDEAEFAEFIEGPVAALRLTMIPNAKTVGLLRGDDDADGVAFSRAQAPAAGIPVQTAQQIVDTIKARWKNAPEVIVLADMNDPRVPEAVRKGDAEQRSGGATGEPEGFYYKGTAYVVAGSLKTPGDVVRVLLHESLGHHGLRGVFGDGLKTILKQIATMRKSEVQAKAAEYGLDMEKESDRLQAAEEVLAVMAQNNPQAGFVKRAIGAIRAWLRENIPGLENMRLTDNDIVTQMILPARRFVQQGPAARVGDGVLAMSRSAGDVTETPAFRKWFGDSKVVDADGKPLVVYHGTRGDIDAFDAGKVKGRFPNSEGFYFTSRPLHASVYADSINNAAEDFNPSSKFIKPVAEGANVMPAYVSLQNPKIIKVSEWGTLESAVDGDGGARVRAARADGHDGVIVERNAGDEYDGKLVIAFRPEQIKSAIGNNGQFDPENPDIRFSRSPRELAGMATDQLNTALKSVTITSIKQAAGYKATDLMGIALGGLGRRQLVEIYGKDLPLDKYNELATQMEADKNEYGAEADTIATEWGKLKDEGALANIMHDATLAKIDPDKPLQPGDDPAAYNALKMRFGLMSKEAKETYRKARDGYKRHHANVREAIKERIERSQMSPERRAALVERMDSEFFAAMKGVYFPLARFGKYVVVVRGADGKVETVARSETMAEAAALRRNLVAGFPASKGYQVDKVILSREFVASRDAVGRGFMQELYQAMDKQDMDPAMRAEMEDTLGQLYLSSLPDVSWAKHGIHRKGTPGFSQDARRAFAQNMFHGARYLAKLRYSDLMQNELKAMQDHVDNIGNVLPDEDGFNGPRMQRVVDEFYKRHDSLMNPNSHPWSTALTSIGFMFHLGLSPASALVNLTQTAFVAYPLMAAKWGFGKAGVALLKASKQAAMGRNDITKFLNRDERRAYDEAVRAGTIDVTMAHDLAGIAQGEDAGVMWRIRPAMRAASFLLHHAERFNRQATFVAAYRLAREAGAAHEAAFEQATKATYDGHFDYSSGNRPRFMQGNAAKVILLFKSYAQNMVYTLARNAYQSVNGLDPKERAEARKALAGILATHAMAAGVLGLPMVTTILAAISAAGSDDDEPFDAQVALQNMLADTFGQKPAEVITRGLSRLGPWDISGRVGLDRLIFPDVQEGLEGQRLAESAAFAALGPVAGIGLNILKGIQEIGDGHMLRGITTMMPAALRGPLNAVRLSNEGAQDKTGIPIVDEVDAASVFGQALGFSPSVVRQATEGKRAVLSYDRALNERRQELMTQYARGAMKQDAEAMQEAREAIQAFNEKNPGRRITMMQLHQSVRNRERRIDQSDNGVYLPKNRREAMDQGRFALTE